MIRLGSAGRAPVAGAEPARPCLRIIRAVFAALAGPAGVAAHRPGALERAHLVLGRELFWSATSVSISRHPCRAGSPRPWGHGGRTAGTHTVGTHSWMGWEGMLAG